MRMRYPLWVLLMEISIVTVVGIQVFPIPFRIRQAAMSLGSASAWQTLVALHFPLPPRPSQPLKSSQQSKSQRWQKKLTRNKRDFALSVE